MSRQFILLDHSIVDAGGHYLEYARSLLGAAKAEGFRTVLAINQDGLDLECPEADLIIKPFSKTFWENQTQSKMRTIAGFLFNKIGMGVQLACAEKFAGELAILIRQAEITDSDIVFIPTLGGTELMGISLYSGYKAAARVHWHLLFRRDVPPPRAWFDVKSRVVKWQVKGSFILANAAFKIGTCKFYTDTEELTYRYESMGVGVFNTLPIPIDEHLGYKQAWHEGPLVVSYIGDLRVEKGGHLLPIIIESLRNDGFDASRVVFRIQGNLPKGTTSRALVRAKKALTSKKWSGVEVLDGPLNRETYRDLLLGSDVVLLPYSTTNYAARSSGVFAEAVAAGIPTIHPLDSWMGRNSLSMAQKGFRGAENIEEKLKSVIHAYHDFEMASFQFSKKWRSIHSAKRLTQILVNK